MDDRIEKPPASAPDKPTTQPPPDAIPTSDECDLIADVERRRKAAERAHAVLLGDAAHRLRLEKISASMPALTAEQLAKRDEELAERSKRDEFAKRDLRWKDFIEDRGQRYADCRLATFEPPDEAGQQALARLTEYCRNVEQLVADGQGLLLFGPKGTGKDHLVVAVARLAIYRGARVTWQNGMDLFGEVRDRMETDQTERELVNRLVGADVLYLSDPLPPFGRVSDFQASMVFRILDGRYSRRRPTWCTVNVQGGRELEERLGAQNADRLRDGAWAIFCNWPTYRKAHA